MHTAASASPIPGPAPFAADLPPVPAPITAPIDPADVHDAEVQLLRAIVAKQHEALESVHREVGAILPPSLAYAVIDAIVTARLSK